LLYFFPYFFTNARLHLKEFDSLSTEPSLHKESYFLEGLLLFFLLQPTPPGIPIIFGNPGLYPLDVGTGGKESILRWPHAHGDRIFDDTMTVKTNTKRMITSTRRAAQW
jgi:hypothetical protein